MLINININIFFFFFSKSPVYLVRKYLNTYASLLCKVKKNKKKKRN